VSKVFKIKCLCYYKHMNTGSIIQLHAVGPNQPISYNDKKSYAPHYKIYKFNGNRLQLQRNSDMMIPLYIKSDNPIDFLTLVVGGTTLCKIPLDFCNKLNGFKINSTTTYKYKLPYELFKINIPAAQINGLFSYELHIESQHTCNAKLYCKEVIVSTTILNNLQQNPQHHICFQEQSVTVISNVVTTLNLYFGNCHKGIFLDNITKGSIKNVKLVINGAPRLDYDKEILDELCQTINDDCIYIPFDCKPFDSDDWNGSLNYSRVTSTLEIQSKINQTISVKGICANTFTQGQLRYMVNYNGGLPPPISYPSSTFTFTSKEIFKFVTTFIKEKLDDNTCCPIESEIIKRGDKYVKCGKCTGTFLKENIDVWLKTQIKCPICFVKWSNDKVYMNSE
jgi:hypothetical protein